MARPGGARSRSAGARDRRPVRSPCSRPGCGSGGSARPPVPADDAQERRRRSERLTDKHVVRLVKTCALAAGLRGDLTEGERRLAFGGHSLRAGLASSAQIEEAHVQKHLGHASAEMTRRYQRKRDRFKVNLTKAAGLSGDLEDTLPCPTAGGSPARIGLCLETKRQGRRPRYARQRRRSLGPRHASKAPSPSKSKKLSARRHGEFRRRRAVPNGRRFAAGRGDDKSPFSQNRERQDPFEASGNAARRQPDSSKDAVTRKRTFTRTAPGAIRSLGVA